MVLGGLLLGCGCASDPAHDAIVAAPDPGWVLLTELETRLLQARSVELHATMSTEGALDAVVNADLFLGEGERARLAVRGRFQDKPVDVLFVSDGTRAQVRGAPVIPAPAAAREALVRGLVAMGLMHNAAVLIAGDGPDHGSGGVRQFVRAERARMADEGLAIALDVVVRDRVMGQAVLSLDGEGNPRDRSQVVHFETGDMHVREIYSRVKLDAPLDVSLFMLDAPPVSAEPAAAAAPAQDPG
jgi:hypothetical protein